MVLDFSKKEIIEALKKLGHEIIEIKVDENLSARRKLWDKNEKYYVLVENERKTISEVFKQEILKSLLK